MTLWWVAAILGGLGGAVADGSRLASTMLSSRKWPWSRREQRMPIVVALVVRTGIAAILAGVVSAQQAVGWSDQPLILFLLGLAAPTVVQGGAKIGRVAFKAIAGEVVGGGGGVA
ncbi:hypothetical protein Ais01nite_60330 [Asanoa ishikariensis]|uniref:Uncharacterized protein n=1 Tax=Asanoa ishikariensis TaxID=137265 RepID=A0A1H3PAG3_9ACTN|nr:hypothetical protein [Asanoa ishikariensis]GIF67998.1 hypothetical protein Ais01nite_60330 [Asanoa ishikariensis]SDY97815.1 hypothetical protein SAMN05421684_2695 [Asanoa ishikariensis]